MESMRRFFQRLERDILQSFQTLRTTRNDTNGENGISSFTQGLFASGPPRNTLTRRKSVAAESFDPEKEADESDEEPRVICAKSDSQRARLCHAVEGILLFKCLDEEQKAQVIDAMQEKSVVAGEKVITQGDDGDNFYVIESGNYSVYVKGPKDAPDSLGRKVGTYTGQGSFGELALMYNTSRAATVIAQLDGIVWLLDRKTFRRIVLKAAFIKRQLYESLLELVPLFKELNAYERTNVADALQSRIYPDKALILAQGETGKEMFFIESGAVKIVVTKDDKEVELNMLHEGAYFGELALITKQPRAASAYAVGKTKVAVLDVESFERLMGPCLNVMQRNIDTYEKQLHDLLGPSYDLNCRNLRSTSTVNK